jgi:hypothetical protein
MLSDGVFSFIASFSKGPKLIIEGLHELPK